MSDSMKEVLRYVAKAHRIDAKAIEPLDLLSGVVIYGDTRLAQLLELHGITPASVAKALDSGSSGY